MVRPPRQQTLKKYGLDKRGWMEILDRQGGVCAICKRVPSSGRFVVDHLHVQGYRRMKPEKKRVFVRGLLCTHCNRFYVAKGITIEKARAILDYLIEFNERVVKEHV